MQKSKTKKIKEIFIMPQKIGFQYSKGDFDTVPLEQISNNPEEDNDEDTKLLSDFIPGAVYDGSGNIVTQESFKAEIKRNKAEARHYNWSAISKALLYSSLAFSILMLSYGFYNKYLKTSSNTIKPKLELSK